MVTMGTSGGDFTVGKWQVDPDRLKIRRDNEPEKQITPRAMGVLVALAEAGGRVVHKNNLLDAVWPRAEVTPGVLSQAILELRNAVQDQSADPYFIETVRGRGFRLIPEVSWATGETAPHAEPARQGPASRFRVLGILAAALFAIILVSIYTAKSPERELEVPPAPALLVFPFEDLSKGSDHEYLARGMAEEIAARLSAAPELRLMSNRMFSPYLAHSDDPLSLAKEYGVDLILTGSVQPQNDRVMLFVELADARSAEQLWASRFNRPRGDIYAIQDEIAQSISDLLLQRDLAPRRSSSAPDLRAYDYYLKGRQFLSAINPEATEQAVNLFQAAIELDPGYGPAVASLATALAIEGFLYQKGRERLEEALVTANSAIELDPELADGHYARALSLMGLARFSDSHSAIREAVRLSPSHVDAVFLAGALSDMRGDWIDAVNYYRRALELNPRLPRTVALGRILFLLGDEEKAIEVARRGVLLEPGAPTLYLAHLMTLMGRHDEALAYCLEAVQMRVPRSKNLCGFSAYVAGKRDQAVNWLADDWRQKARAQWGPFTFAPSATHLAALMLDNGDEASAFELLEESEVVTNAELERGNDHWALRYNLAAVAALRGNTERAVEWLRKSFDSGFRDHRLLVIDPALSTVRDEPSFRQLQREIGYLVVQAAEGLDISAHPAAIGVDE